MKLTKTKKVTKKEYGAYLRIVILTIILLIIVLLATILNVMLRDTNNASSDIQYDKHFMMIADNVSSDFTTRTYEAAQKAGQERGAYVELVGSNMTQVFTLQDRIKIAIAAKPDGILIESDNSKETNELIAQAVDAGIPVITYLNDGAYSKRQSYVGSNYYKLGKLYAEEILKDNNTRNISILLMTKDTMPDVSRDSLTTGIVDTIQGANQQIEVSIDLQVVDTNSVFEVQETVHSLLSDEKKEENIICVDENITKYVYQDAVDYNRVGKMNIYGFGISTNILDSIKSGVVQSTASVDVDTMGSTCVNALCEYLKAGYISNYIYVETSIVDRDNINEIEGKLSEDD